MFIHCASEDQGPRGTVPVSSPLSCGCRHRPDASILTLGHVAGVVPTDMARPMAQATEGLGFDTLLLAGPRGAQTLLEGGEVWAEVVQSPSLQTPQATLSTECCTPMQLGQRARGWISGLGCWVLGCRLLALVAAGWMIASRAGPPPLPWRRAAGVLASSTPYLLS